jgi:hypothetical protein
MQRIFRDRDHAAFARALVEIGVVEPSADGTGLHEVEIGGEVHRVFRIRFERGQEARGHAIDTAGLFRVFK